MRGLPSEVATAWRQNGRRLAAGLSTRTLAIALSVLGAACFLLCASIPVDVETEVWLALTVGCAIAALACRPRKGFWRGLLLLLCLLLSLRYFTWRITETLVYYDPVSFIAALLLFGAELYGLLLMLLGLFVNVAPITRVMDPAPLRDDAPRVDVLVPSYNEDPDLLAVTICAATQIAYPAGRLHVHLLDDGGTDAKCDDPDPARAAIARRRRQDLQALCARFGATYRTRPRNIHAKAGNINEALPNLSGELVLILDADHVPTADILARTVPLYRHDPKLFLVQTPHFFMNPDTVEKNLDLFLKMPGENEMFHRAIQSGLDFWNAAIFCGSAAVIHRGRLLEVGGIATSTITEDAETALALHARGYTSAYVARPMVAGLAPETFTGMVTQRVRWGQGMAQILLLKNPLGRPGLTVAQRLGYLSLSIYWFFPFARVIFLFAPVAYLVFGLRIYAANTAGVLAFVLPHIIASAVSNAALFNRFRWPLISHVYETLLGLLMLRPLVATLRNPRAPDFKVTPKGEHLHTDFVSPLARPFYVILGITILAFPMGIWRIYADAGQMDLTLTTMGWEVFNLLVLLGALGALFERKQRRGMPRLAADMPAALVADGRRVEGAITNLSTGGTRFVARDAAMDLASNSPLEIEVAPPHLTDPVRLRVLLRTRQGGLCGLAFAPGEDQFRRIVSLVHGDSGRWAAFWADENRTSRATAVFRMLLHTGLAAMGSHALHIAHKAWAGLPTRRPAANIRKTRARNDLYGNAA